MLKIKDNVYLDEKGLKSLGFDQGSINEFVAEAKRGVYWVLWAVFLKGEKGEFACVEGEGDYDDRYQKSEPYLNIKYPLSLGVTEQRKWVALASKFFKRINFMDEIEISREENPELYKKLNDKWDKRKKRSKKENPDLVLKTGLGITYYRRYSNPKPKDRSETKERYKKMRKIYKDNRKQGQSVAYALSQVKKKLPDIWDGRNPIKNFISDMDIDGTGLKWTEVFNKLVGNNLAIPEGENAVSLKVNPSTKKELLRNLFEDNFLKIFSILHDTYLKSLPSTALDDKTILKICRSKNP